MVLSFDFTENATRGQIFDALFSAMDEAQHKRFYEIIERAEVPEKHHHDIGEINKTIDALDAPDQVKNDLRSVYAILAAAEAKVHGCDVSQTHFHEVGKAGGIRNALAICAEFYVLAPEEVVATPIQPGEGEIECAHGVLSLPAPANLIRGFPFAIDNLGGVLAQGTMMIHLGIPQVGKGLLLQGKQRFGRRGFTCGNAFQDLLYSIGFHAPLRSNGNIGTGIIFPLIHYSIATHCCSTA